MTLIVRPGVTSIVQPGSGKKIFDTGARAFQQPSGGSIVVPVGGGVGPMPGGMAFPSMDTGYSYSYNSEVYTDPTSGSRLTAEGCVSCGTLIPQEWGPSIVGAHNLADIDLGAAPSWADFLEMTVNLTQTPPTIPNGAGAAPMYNPWPCEITNGATMDCEDGCCVVEAMAGLARQFWVEIVSSRIVLRRQQSVTGSQIIPAASGNPAYSGLFLYAIESKSQGVASPNMNLGQSNQCSITNAANTASVYNGTLTVYPVNYHN